MSKTYSPNHDFALNAHIPSKKKYSSLYERSINEPIAFWEEVAGRLSWYESWHTVSQYDFVNGNIEWFSGGKLNASYNCIDRHIEDGYGEKTAIIWEGNDPNQSKKLSYNELLSEVSKFSNALKELGVKKGDRVCIYMQMVPELAIAVLACARIGAVHSVVFGAFSSDSLKDRINDSHCKILITQDTGVRGTKHNIPMKANADSAVAQTPSIEHVIVVCRTGESIEMDSDRDIWWHEAISDVSPICEPEIMDAEDPLFILYTSGSTGKPKGVLHTTGGYLTYVSFTHEMIFDYRPGDIYWCTADLGWITGHSYIIYGPLSNRATTLMFEGVPNYPDFGRFWDVVDKHNVNQFYTAPTALRALMKEGNKWVESRDLSSLRLLGTVGEPIKEPEWKWYFDIVGKGTAVVILEPAMVHFRTISPLGSGEGDSACHDRGGDGNGFIERSKRTENSIQRIFLPRFGLVALLVLAQSRDSCWVRGGGQKRVGGASSQKEECCSNSIPIVHEDLTNLLHLILPAHITTC